jgi:hypothetical protein
MLAIVFEGIAILAPNILHAPMGRLEKIEAMLAAFRMVVLMTMVSLHALPAIMARSVGYHSDAERDALLPNKDAATKMNQLALPTIDAQSTGWLDYFIGFSALLPYIWYVNTF